MKPITLNPCTASYVFAVHTQAGAVIWSEQCELQHMLTFRNAERNSLWRDMVKHAPITVEPLLISDDRREVDNFAYAWIKTHGHPICNAQGRIVQEVGYSVECIETGEQFATQAAACDRFQASPSAMSNHLRGKRGHKTVRGYTFRKI